jgi:hypothetical protein
MLLATNKTDWELKKARKDAKCFSFEKIIDSDLTNYKDLVEEIVEKYPSGYLEVAHVQYYDANLETYQEVKPDQDLMAMFEKHYCQGCAYVCCIL